MAKPIVDTTPDILIQITKDGTHIGHPEHITGYKAGEIVNLTKEFGDLKEARRVADLLVGLKVAVPADGGSYAKSKKRGEELVVQAKQAAVKSMATAQMMQFDDLPPELRALCREIDSDSVIGDVIALYQSGEPIPDIVKAYKR